MLCQEEASTLGERQVALCHAELAVIRSSTDVRHLFDIS